jgi:2,3-bisphosphoglycerate-independent phosphoglycerate mutase
MHHKAFLLILDGWGIGSNPKSDAIHNGNTPYVDSLYDNYPHAQLVTYGSEVGLPDGQMGNSEVGHLNIGAGRIVYQELARINNEIKSGNFGNNKVLTSALQKAQASGSTLHLIGLLSDGGVHSHTNHLKALCQAASKHKIENVCIHAFMDGRDTAPNAGIDYIKDLNNYLLDYDNIKLSSIIGRYYAMDRDSRWERIKKCYDLIVNGTAEITTDNPEAIIQEQYDKGITDEFMESISVQNNDAVSQTINDGDLVIFFNFRTDRPRQLTRALSQEDFEDYDMKKLDLDFLTMTKYDAGFNNVNVLYEKDNIQMTIGEVIANQNLSQLRIAETEKYPHVTFFLSGGREEEFKKEKRIVINSPNVATYDLKPEMSAYKITNEVHKNIKEDHPDLIVLNYANADMVGHTGNFKAATEAVQHLDSCLEALIPIALKAKYKIVIIADHGNSDYMINDDGSPHTAHTTNPVPVIVLDPEDKVKGVSNGKLADIAPTLLELMNVPIPEEMTGVSLIRHI